MTPAARRQRAPLIGWQPPDSLSPAKNQSVARSWRLKYSLGVYHLVNLLQLTMYSGLPRILFPEESELDDYEEELATSSGGSSDPISKDNRESEIVSITDDSDPEMKDLVHVGGHVSLASADGFNEGFVSMDVINQLESRLSQSLLSPECLSKVRQLRLFESPHTPKTLLRRAENDVESVESVPKLYKCRSLFRSAKSTPSKTLLAGKGQKRRNASSPYCANVNPFTPTGMLLEQSKQKRRKTCSLTGSFLNPGLSIGVIKDVFDDTDNESENEMDTSEIRRNTLKPGGTSRYMNDFVELCLIGKGEFGSVYKCINRLDGCIYATKRSRKPLKGSLNEKRALNEVYAHAVLGKHSRVVQYYSAWAENDHMYIQNEYCEGGSLSSLIAAMKSKGEVFTEPHLKKILLHISQGLKYIHSQNLVHLDIKPANIFISKKVDLSTSPTAPKMTESSDDGFEDSNDTDISDVIYKIGDLGLVTSVVHPQVEEGDCRYLPREILHENYAHLPKADVFSLGLTIVETATQNPLPKNGDDWHVLRNGTLPKLQQCSEDFCKLLKKMLHKDPEKRPSTCALVQSQVLIARGSKSRAQLRKELNLANLRIERLSKQLEEVSKCVQKSKPFSPTESPKREPKSSFSRSKSVTSF